MKRAGCRPLKAREKELALLVDERTKQLQQEVASRKRTEQALRESEQRYRHLFEDAPVGIYRANADGSYISVNRTLARMYGYDSPEELMTSVSAIGHQVCVDPACREEFNRLMQERGMVQGFEYEVYRKGGGTIWLSENARAIRDEEGSVLYYEGSVQDITKSKWVEETLAKERDLLRTIIDNVPDYIYAKDTESRYFVSNIAHRRFLGATTPDEVIGKSVFELYPQELAMQYYTDDQEVIRSGQPLLHREERSVDQAGNVVWNLTAKVPLRDSGGKIVGLVGIARDITERKQAEEEIRRYAAELARSNGDLQQFAYVASHDLQEPLRMVASYTDLLARRYKSKLDRDADELIHFIVDATGRMQTLISDLLAYARVKTQAQPFELTDAEAVLNQALANLQMAIRERGAIITHAPLPKVLADGCQLVQVFQNLISNAIKFCKDKRPEVHVEAEPREREWLFSVRDNGIGIDPKYADRIFQIFQRLHGKGEYSGTGIGLAVCKKIVERHNGRIWVDSEPGKGSTFYFTVPDGSKEHEH